MTVSEAEKIITEELRKLPEYVRKKIENVGIFIEERPPRKGILGLYHGIPYKKRGIFYSGFPDKIFIYIKEIEKYGKNREKEILRQVLLHEIGHYFGLNDFELKKIGY